MSALFKDGTIGGNINIVIVGLILLEEEQVIGLRNTQLLFPRKIQAKSGFSLALSLSLSVIGCEFLTFPPLGAKSA